MGEAIEEFNASFAKEEAEIAALRDEVQKRKKLVDAASDKILTQRRQAENYRSDINTLLARVQANIVLRDKNRKKLDNETALLKAQQNELNEKKVYLKRFFDLEKERDGDFIKTISGMNGMQLEARKEVLAALSLQLNK
jgi:chromosome segregation ATPase